MQACHSSHTATTVRVRAHDGPRHTCDGTNVAHTYLFDVQKSGFASLHLGKVATNASGKTVPWTVYAAGNLWMSCCVFRMVSNICNRSAATSRASKRWRSALRVAHADDLLSSCNQHATWNENKQRMPVKYVLLRANRLQYPSTIRIHGSFFFVLCQVREWGGGAGGDDVIR